jgi:pimeloyl-[acyl-carrier protein] methyl ester esterase
MRASQAAAIRLYECLYGLDLKPNVSKILHPTLIVHGELDTIVPLADAEWLATKIPNSHLQVIRGAGHVPTVTRPVEVAELINRFFDLNGVS